MRTTAYILALTNRVKAINTVKSAMAQIRDERSATLAAGVGHGTLPNANTQDARMRDLQAELEDRERDVATLLADAPALGES